MKQLALIVAATVAAIATGGANGEEFGTLPEAKAMLTRALEEVRVDQSHAFDKFNSNAPGFRDRDLFVFCFGASDGKFTAHESMVTHDVRTLHDSKGVAYGEKMFMAAREGGVAEITYLSPFPGSTSQVPKRAFLSRVSDQVCGVSAYLYNGPGFPTE